MSPRVQARLFIALCYAVTVCLVLASTWLFLSNAGELVPKTPVHGGALRDWRASSNTNEFAGGFWRDEAFWQSSWLSVATATLTALVAALLGIPAAYALARFRIPGRGFIEVLFSSIIVLPASTVGLGLIILFQYGPLNEAQRVTDFKVPHTLFPGIVVAQLVLALAMGLSAWRAAFDGVDPRLEFVARSLGASRWRAFFTVTIPAARQGLMVGFVLAWVRAVAEFGSVLIFCGTFRELPLSRFSGLTRALCLHQADPLPVAMWLEIEAGNLECGFGLAFALLLISGLSVYAIHRVGAKGYVW